MEGSGESALHPGLLLLLLLLGASGESWSGTRLMLLGFSACNVGLLSKTAVTVGIGEPGLRSYRTPGEAVASPLLGRRGRFGKRSFILAQG